MDRSEVIATVLAELQNAGVNVSADDDLATIRARLEECLVDVATAEPEAFDRLVQLRIALDPETEDTDHAD